MNYDEVKLLVNTFLENEEYSQCLDFLKNKDHAVNKSVYLLIKKAKLIQKVDDETPLSDVVKCYKLALEIEPRNGEVLVELGYFLLNVLDDARTALDKFDSVLAMVNGHLSSSVEKDAYKGKLDCLVELYGLSNALDDVLHSKILSNSQKLNYSTILEQYIKEGNTGPVFWPPFDD